MYWLKYGTMKQLNDAGTARRGRGRPAANFVDRKLSNYNFANIYFQQAHFVLQQQEVKPWESESV
jgi:hypothetical protein